MFATLPLEEICNFPAEFEDSPREINGLPAHVPVFQSFGDSATDLRLLSG